MGSRLLLQTHFLLALVALVFTPAALGQISARIVLEPSEIPFYKQSFLRIEVEAPVDAEIELPDLRLIFEKERLMSEDSGVTDYRKEPLEEGRVLITETYALDPIFVKDYVFAPITLKLGGGEELVLPVPTLRARALTPAEEEAVAFFDGEITGGPASTTRPLSDRWEFWAVVIISGLALAVLLVYWFLTYRKLRLIEPLKDPWEVALARLIALAERNLAKEGKFEVYYVDLSSILRYYIEGRFYLHAPDRSTPEFLEEMMETEFFSDEQEEFLREVLRLCDLVKFAKHIPSMIDVEESFVKVRSFVEETIPSEEELQEAEAA